MNGMKERVRKNLQLNKLIGEEVNECKQTDDEEIKCKKKDK